MLTNTICNVTCAKLENCFEISYKAIIVFVSGYKSVAYGDSM